MQIYAIISVIWTIFISFSSVNSQKVEYANRIRNLSLTSETDSIVVLNMTIYRSNMEHKVALKFDVTKDIDIRFGQVIINRCVYEKSACEYFQKWTFATNLKNAYHMKNQLWTPAVKNIKPPITFPYIRKNVYETSDLNIDATTAVAWYPDVTNYYFQADLQFFDPHNKRGLIIWLETSIHAFVRRNGIRNRGNSSRKI